jgi:hypothetical protein
MLKLCSASPTPRSALACSISTVLGHAPKACHAGDPHTHDLRSAGPCPAVLHRPAQSLLCLAMSPGPAKLQATDIHDLCWDTPSGLHRPTPSPLGCSPHACIGLHDLRQYRVPKACQAGNPQTHRLSTLPAHALLARQASAPKAH